MKESQVINGWMREGERKGELRQAREILLRGLRGKMSDPVPEDVRVVIEGTYDLDALNCWFDVVMQTNSLEQFRAAIHPPP